MMRTLLLVGIAGIAALAADAAHANHGNSHDSQTRVERRVIVVDAASADDAAVYRSGDDRVLAESDYRGRWQGEWDGSWDAEGETYRGTYEGEYDAHGADYDVPRSDARHDRRPPAPQIRYSDRDLERMCRRDNGAGGAAIGAVVGGVAGNRVAGRGNRTVGTLVGTGVGAVVGAVIDRNEDRRACADYWRRVDGQRTSGYGNGDRTVGYGNGDRNYDGGDYQGGYTYESGSYYGGGITTIVIPGQPIIVEETETTYETVTYAAPRARHVARRAAPRRRAPARPRATCICR